MFQIERKNINMKQNITKVEIKLEHFACLFVCVIVDAREKKYQKNVHKFFYEDLLAAS